MYQCIRPLDLIIMIFPLENYDFENKFLHLNPTCEMIFERNRMADYSYMYCTCTLSAHMCEQLCMCLQSACMLLS